MLWLALAEQNEGNLKTRKVKMDQLKKEFENFNAIGNESLRDMTARYYHLMSKMYQYGVVYTSADHVERFAEALPPHWHQWLDILKSNNAYQTLSINEFITELENKEIEVIRRANKALIPQNPSIYYGNPLQDTSVGGTKPQTAFVVSPDPVYAFDNYGPPADVPPPTYPFGPNQYPLNFNTNHFGVNPFSHLAAPAQATANFSGPSSSGFGGAPASCNGGYGGASS